MKLFVRYVQKSAGRCTATIIYMMFKEKKMEIPEKIAGLMCSAIISDTLLYRSPTCTAIDKIAAEELAAIAGIETEVHAKAMFAAGSNLSKKTTEEIFLSGFQKIQIRRYFLWNWSDQFNGS